MNDAPSHLNRTLQKLGKLRPSVRWPILSWAFGRNVPFMRTARLQFKDLTEERALLYLRNRRRVQNHIGTIHAAAVALLAETASGTLLAMNLPDDRVPLLKSMQVDYTKLSHGDMLAEATLDKAARKRLRTETRGEIVVPVTITDETGIEPAKASMRWGWFSKSEGRAP